MTKKSWDSDWIHFSKRARRGIIVLLILFIAIAVAPRLYYNYFYSPPHYDVEVRSLLASTNKADSIEAKVAKVTSRYTQPSALFNPNEYSLEEWMAIGLSEKQAASILKYLKSGAVLKIKSDLKKLYVIDEDLYVLLEPKVALPDSIEKPSYIASSKYSSTKNEKSFEQNQKETVKEELAPISINTATAWDLKKIPGIGPYFAKEIIKVREAYGGIISYDQLFDVYLMDEEKIEAMKPFLILDATDIKRLNINTASEKELRDHPLISYDMAKSIVFFRENHRPYKRIDEVILSPYIDHEKFKALKPYLKVE
ncbi:helix-hairpin-helix domain-containing protein [Brumimicrobium glaciale]|uniref:Helix-hairpin-helix domain-containing protein n=1 Tax=Brumimicrobium glaciale TaxID=200475 RepID=A0A4Q4KIB9_9FLAO|nr:helix-hairpin-helix domain-containing protein [Brumimicrobium glaciale]RYM32397.1 helix-hairpin-helix domain-containing protein [Brumimicrobium glaciale]